MLWGNALHAELCQASKTHQKQGSVGFAYFAIFGHIAHGVIFIFMQAVVNEDAQGNLADLQNEIKRLKEALLQYTSGRGPVPPLGKCNELDLQGYGGTDQVSNGYSVSRGNAAIPVTLLSK